MNSDKNNQHHQEDSNPQLDTPILKVVEGGIASMEDKKR